MSTTFDGLWSFTYDRHPGLAPGSRFFFLSNLDGERRGGWVYIIADRYRGTLCVGVTADLAARIFQHTTNGGSNFGARYGLTRLVWAEHGDDITGCIAHEKRLERWHRAWKIELIERTNPQWDDLFAQLA